VVVERFVKAGAYRAAAEASIRRRIDCAHEDGDRPGSLLFATVSRTQQMAGKVAGPGRDPTSGRARARAALAAPSEHQEDGRKTHGQCNSAQRSALLAHGPKHAGGAARPDHGGLELVGGREQARQGTAGPFGRRTQRDKIGFDLLYGTRLDHAATLPDTG